jgi:hypothetical protein
VQRIFARKTGKVGKLLIFRLFLKGIALAQTLQYIARPLRTHTGCAAFEMRQGVP